MTEAARDRRAYMAEYMRQRRRGIAKPDVKNALVVTRWDPEDCEVFAAAKERATAAQVEAPKKRRRRRHNPNGDSRAIIVHMADYGLSIKQISLLTGLGTETLYRHYGKELKTATVRKDLAVLRSAFLQAVGGPDEDWTKANPAATQAYLEARGIWVRRGRQNHGFGEPWQEIDVWAKPWAYHKLTDEQLDQFEQLLMIVKPDGDEAPTP